MIDSMTDDDTHRPWSEADRQAALKNYAILDTPPEAAFDDIVRLAAAILVVPMAAISLVAQERQWLKAEVGLGMRDMPASAAMCGRTLSEPVSLVVPDTLLDPRFADHPLVVNAPHVRFYASVLLETPEGIPIGALCVYDRHSRPQGLNEQQCFVLKTLAHQVMTQLELRRSVAERERALIGQHNAESYIRQVIDSAADYAIISTDLKGVITSRNKGASRVLGWSEEQALGKPATIFFTPEDIAAGTPAAEMRCALEQGHAADVRWHVRKNGERFWAPGAPPPPPPARGEAIGFVKIMRDSSKEKRAEENLKQLNDTLEIRIAERTRERDRIWRNSRDLLLTIGGDGVIRSVSPACTILLGYLPEELIDRHFLLFVHPDDQEPSSAALEHALQQPLLHIDMRMRHREGQFLWFSWNAAAEEGIVFATGRDITVEKEQTDQLMRANEARLQFALEAGEMGAWQWNILSQHIIWLQGMAELHGMPDGFVPASFDDYQQLIHPDDRSHVAEVIAKSLADRKDHRVEYRVVWPDSSVHWLEGRGKIFFDNAGNAVQMAGICIDITRRKRTEQDLRFLAQASAEISGLIDYQSTLDKLAYLAVPAFADWCTVDLLEGDGALKRVSVAHVDQGKAQLAHELHRRYPPDPHAPGGTWNILRTGRAELVSEITGEMLEQSIQDPEYLATIKQLGLRSYIGAPLTAHGKTLGVVTFIGAESGRIYGAEDLSLAEDLARRDAIAIEIANLYRALQQSDQAKDVFLATLAHELRNPLAPIMNALGIISLAPDDKPRVEQSTRLMERQVSQLARLVDDLMDISRISTGKIELKKQMTSLADALNSAIETSRPHIETGQHKLLVRLFPTAAMVFADPVRLAQIFTNLLNNAAKYTNPGGQINVALESLPEEFVVRIQDSGIGIPENMLGNVFTIFTQARHPLERSQGGLGIGLSLVKGLVDLHGGFVEAFSEGVGRGSEFVVHLPKPAQPESQSSASAAQENRQEQTEAKRLLVVDDNIDAANTVADILRLLGNEVQVVHDGLTAVEAAMAMKPDIVLLDIGLPGLNGYEVARKLRSQESMRSVILVAVTGWGQDNDKRMAYQAGFDHHWVKPVGLEQLKKIIS